MARGRPLLVLVAFAALVWFAESAGRAEESAPLPLDLEWHAPDECPSAETIRAELGRIARVRPGRTQARLLARGRIEKENGGYRLTLRTERSGEVGERNLVASECRSLGREVTLVLAVAFGEGVEVLEEDDGKPEQDGGAGAATAGSANEKAAANTARAPDAPSSPVPPPEAHEHREPSRSPRKSRASLFLGGGVLTGALPRPAAFAAVGGEFGTNRFWFAPRVTLLPRSDDSLPRQVQARYDGLGGGLSGCLGVPASSWLFAGCVGGGASALRGRSWGASESGQATAPWYTGNAAVSVTWPHRSVVAVRLEGELRVSVNEPRFVVEGLGDVHRVARLVPSLGLAIVLSPRHSPPAVVASETGPR